MMLRHDITYLPSRKRLTFNIQVRGAMLPIFQPKQVIDTIHVFFVILEISDHLGPSEGYITKPFVHVFLIDFISSLRSSLNSEVYF